MTDKQIIIDEQICEYYSDTKEDEEGANPIVGWCNDNYCKCEGIPFDECLVKAIQLCKLKDRQLKVKEQECEELKEDYATAKSMYDLCQSDFMELAKIKDNYKQALLSIKNIATDTELLLMDKNYQIIQIIKGVLKDEV